MEVRGISLAQFRHRVDTCGFEKICILRSDALDPREVSAVHPFQNLCLAHASLLGDVLSPSARRSCLEQLLFRIDPSSKKLLRIGGSYSLNFFDVSHTVSQAFKSKAVSYSTFARRSGKFESTMDIDGLWDYNDPAGTESKFRSLLDTLTDPLEIAELRTQIARTYGLRKQFDACDTELDLAEPTVEGTSTRANVRYFLERGRRWNSSGFPADAVTWFERARALAAQVGEVGLEIDAIHMLAIADGERAMDWNLLALAKAEQSEDPRGRRWLASLYNNIGWTHFENGDIEAALDLFVKAVPIREAMGNEVNLRTAQWCVARTLRELGRIQEAKDMMVNLHAAEPDGEFTNQEMALLLSAEGKREEAKPFARKAYEILSKDDWMVKNRAEILNALNDLI